MSVEVLKVQELTEETDLVDVMNNGVEEQYLRNKKTGEIKACKISEVAWDELPSDVQEHFRKIGCSPKEAAL